MGVRFHYPYRPRAASPGKPLATDRREFSWRERCFATGRGRPSHPVRQNRHSPLYLLHSVETPADRQDQQVSVRLPFSKGEQKLFEPASPTGVDALARVDAVAAALESMQERLTSQVQVHAFMQELCRRVVITFAGADMAGITLLSKDGGAETSAFTDRRVVTIDGDQYTLGEGPCVEAARSQQIVRARFEEAKRRWPQLAERLGTEGVRSFLSAPLTLGSDNVGALNLYSFDDHGFNDLDAALLRVYMTSVESTVVLAREAEHAYTELAGLKKAMATRAVIEQAKGIVMALRRIPADDAFEILVTNSQRENVKLSTLAQRIVDFVAEGKDPIF
ncbi:GAF and ANTAR domain-containing protein [Rhodococcus triatomae]|uniref:GAF and ANTAR domain-containing protein n=1 Tax=Rhodococcus triatomae TaxID=300028 RepID=UPI001626A33D|nr:GAF and ANTAR domain-containing protein [Rhodococcus triatomae]QNG20489.1 GAF and ANTAR domain-containing protein [Rhodococcus triatomae]